MYNEKGFVGLELYAVTAQINAEVSRIRNLIAPPPKFKYLMASLANSDEQIRKLTKVTYRYYAS
jgi:hypothetical protein